MEQRHDATETWDRLTLLLIAQPRAGWEDTFAEITHREVERLAPHPDASKEKGPTPTKAQDPQTLPQQGAI
jgi:hypothetical protein